MSRPAAQEQPLNTLILCADQLNPTALGYAGSPWSVTPAVDELARQGTVFSDAVCASPICVPARASLVTGRYVHELGTWDNGHPYSGEAPSWGHRLSAAGQEVATIGKLHFAGDDAPTGFEQQHVPMHAEEGHGDLYSMLRDDLPDRPELRRMIAGAHSGDSEYTTYDRVVTDAACEWLRDHTGSTTPWTTFVSHVSPHHPLIAPPEFDRLFDEVDIPLPRQWTLDERPTHPALERLRRYYGFHGELSVEEVRRARRTYFALVAYLDAQVRQILDVLDETGLRERTRIIFTADHGDNIGEHGLWWKNNMYAGSVGVPLILTGPGITPGARSTTPVSHLDILPTLLEWSGLPAEPDLPGRSLAAIAGEPDDPNRLVFSEYHATGSSAGMFMVQDSHYKYVEYVGEAPQLFDRRADPGELVDLSGEDRCAEVVDGYAQHLRSICDPEVVNERARTSQRAKVDAFGGPEAVRAAGFRTHVPPPATRR
ncbi:sulfatase-like hydrolase/transferase [Ornithinimicrobium cavernae]|uniref:sulfatase-like hydrolase/transferase n=1 Tax=Ornithinimicrobium cavernae TaxID=2666047 RepID=UPI00137A2992|nr:sulfatase-like hydrolase/transferase [Ornithinimicrobium cavernae]